MILELDCGNSFIKWRVLEANARSVVGEGVVDSDLALLDDLKTLKGLALKFCRLVSVRTADETSELTALLKASFNVSAVCAVPAREMSGCAMVMRISSGSGWIAGSQCWAVFIWLQARALSLISVLL